MRHRRCSSFVCASFVVVKSAKKKKMQTSPCDHCALAIDTAADPDAGLCVGCLSARFCGRECQLGAWFGFFVVFEESRFSQPSGWHAGPATRRRAKLLRRPAKPPLRALSKWSPLRPTNCHLNSNNPRAATNAELPRRPRTCCGVWAATWRTTAARRASSRPGGSLVVSFNGLLVL